VLAVLLLGACGGGHSGPADGAPADSYVPQCNPVQGTPNLGLVEVASGFDMPVYVTSEPTNAQRLYVLEKSGSVRVIDHGTVLSDPFLTVLTPTLSGLSDERGLLGLAFAPDYAQSGKLYVFYVNTSSDEEIDQYTVMANDPNHADPSSKQMIFSNQDFASNHNGGHLEFGPDGYLWFGVGDGGGGGDPMQYGQNLDVTFGKIMRLDVSHLPPTAPPDNPFVGTGHEPSIWSYGWRNPWRWSFDKQTGDLYVGDVGQDTWEEVDVEKHGTPGGGNYGWSVREGANCYNATTCNSAGMIDPIWNYNHGTTGSCVIGGYVYRGCAMPGYRGTYFFADYGSGWVRSLVWDGAGSYTNMQEWTSLEGGSIVSFGEDADGELYIVRQDSGQIMKIVPQ
jgi:glucose/arabinose dehydrogenase